MFPYDYMQVVHSWLEDNISDAVFFPGCHTQRHTGDVNFHYPDQELCDCNQEAVFGNSVGVCSVASGMPDSVTPWTRACKAPLFMGFFPARILEWFTMLSSRQSF